MIRFHFVIHILASYLHRLGQYVLPYERFRTRRFTLSGFKLTRGSMS